MKDAFPADTGFIYIYMPYQISAHAYGSPVQFHDIMVGTQCNVLGQTANITKLCASNKLQCISIPYALHA